eukprot:EG_transcript_3374
MANGEGEGVVAAALQYEAEVSAAQVAVSAAAARMEDEYGFARQKVVDHFNVLAIELDRRKQQLLTDLEQLRNRKARRLTEQTEVLAALLNDMHELRLRIKHAEEEEHLEDVAHFSVQLQKTVGTGVALEPVEETKFQYCLQPEEDVAAVHRFGALEVDPEVTGAAFMYKSNFDTNGILYWIGCNYGTAEYRNPADLGLVTVAASSCEHGHVNHAVAHPLFSPKHQTFMTESVPGSWLSLFLGVQYVVCPTAYTLKNCIITPCHALANWDFQGSRDGATWVTLKSHRDDRMLLPGRGSIWTWQIEGCKQYFNRFRIFTTGPNQHTQPGHQDRGLDPAAPLQWARSPPKKIY